MKIQSNNRHQRAEEKCTSNIINHTLLFIHPTTTFHLFIHSFIHLSIYLSMTIYPFGYLAVIVIWMWPKIHFSIHLYFATNRHVYLQRVEISWEKGRAAEGDNEKKEGWKEGRKEDFEGNHIDSLIGRTRRWQVEEWAPSAISHQPSAISGWKCNHHFWVLDDGTILYTME